MAVSDTTAAAPETTDPPAEPEYSFEGFNLEFSFKVALTPPAAAPRAAPARVGSGAV